MRRQQGKENGAISPRLLEVVHISHQRRSRLSQRCLPGLWFEINEISNYRITPHFLKVKFSLVTANMSEHEVKSAPVAKSIHLHSRSMLKTAKSAPVYASMPQ